MEAPKSEFTRIEKNKLLKKGNAEGGTIAAVPVPQPHTSHKDVSSYRQKGSRASREGQTPLP